MILYEYPFNERIRTYLRLEHLFRRLRELTAREHPLDHHYAIQTLFEIMDVGARSDLKSEILKDLDRHRQTYIGYRGNPAIAEQALEQLITQLDVCYNALVDDSGKTGHALSSNDWLMAIRSRISIPGGTCEFDLPAYHHWQHLPPTQRQHDLQQWAGELDKLAQPVQLLLHLLRDTGNPQMMVAAGGHLQQNLPQGKSFQLLRLRIDANLALIPEISGNRLMYSVRLQRRGEDGKLWLASDQDTELEITLCAG